MGEMAKAPFESITIVGFGLIGASLAAAVKARDPNVRIVAADLPKAIEHEAVIALSDERCDASSDAALAAAMAASELTVLAAPVRVIERHLPIALRFAPLVTDCGSTKRTILERARGAGKHSHFVPGHPMAGRPIGGAGAATSDLFEKRRWILCPDGAEPNAVSRVKQLVEFVGAQLVEMDVGEHDRAVAVTSHAPQVFASVLTVLARRMNAERAAGPAFGSATRVAGGNLSMWRDIFSTNADAVADVILDLAAELRRVGEALRDDDIESVVEVLKNARDLRSGKTESEG